MKKDYQENGNCTQSIKGRQRKPGRREDTLNATHPVLCHFEIIKKLRGPIGPRNTTLSSVS